MLFLMLLLSFSELYVFRITIQREHELAFIVLFPYRTDVRPKIESESQFSMSVDPDEFFKHEKRLPGHKRSGTAVMISVVDDMFLKDFLSVCHLHEQDCIYD